MSFDLIWTTEASSTFDSLKKAAKTAYCGRATRSKTKSSKQEGLFKQVEKTLAYLQNNPRHPSLNTHEYDSLKHPWDHNQKVFEAYAQNKTPGAYRIFWCYGPDKGQITIISITPHP